MTAGNCVPATDPGATIDGKLVIAIVSVVCVKSNVQVAFVPHHPGVKFEHRAVVCLQPLRVILDRISLSGLDSSHHNCRLLQFPNRALHIHLNKYPKLYCGSQP